MMLLALAVLPFSSALLRLLLPYSCGGREPAVAGRGGRGSVHPCGVRSEPSEAGRHLQGSKGEEDQLCCGVQLSGHRGTLVAGLTTLILMFFTHETNYWS